MIWRCTEAVITELSRKQLAAFCGTWVRIPPSPPILEELMNKIIKEKLKQVLILFIIIVAFGTVLSIMLRYESEGEQNMPFTLSEMILASSVDEMKKEENPDNVIWNLDINQYNDIL